MLGLGLAFWGSGCIDIGFGGWGLGFRASDALVVGCGFSVWGVGCVFRVWGTAFGGLGFRV